jgi:multimeric flavodoxin WrbA
MKVLILDCGLKMAEKASESKTLKVCKWLRSRLEENDASVVLLRVADLDTQMEKGPPPEWSDTKTAVINQVMGSDVLVMATPIWWDGRSSLCQRVVEWLDDYDNVVLQDGEGSIEMREQPGTFHQKLFGAVVVGAEDGTQHVNGGLLNFAQSLGFLIPPFSTVHWTHQEEDLARKYVDLMARSLVRTNRLRSDQI